MDGEDVDVRVLGSCGRRGGKRRGLMGTGRNNKQHSTQGQCLYRLRINYDLAGGLEKKSMVFIVFCRVCRVLDIWGEQIVFYTSFDLGRS